MARVDDLKAVFNNPARPNRYKVIFSIPGAVGASGVVRQMSILCKAGEIPSSQIENIQISYHGRTHNIPGDRPPADPWTATFMNNGDFAIREALEKWHNQINNVVENTGGDISNLYADIKVQQLDRDDSILKTYTLKNAYPTNVAAIELGYDNTNSIEEFTCEWVYEIAIPDHLA